MFSHLFGIRPWEWDLLTIEQTRILERSADDWNKNQRG